MFLIKFVCLSGTNGSALFGLLRPNRVRPYRATITARVGREVITLRRQFRSGIYCNGILLLELLVKDMPNTIQSLLESVMCI